MIQNRSKHPSHPSMDEVCKYAATTVRGYIAKFARHLQSEIKEEISQEAIVRACAVYPKLNVKLGWKSFIQIHARGAVLDFLKAGQVSTADEFERKRVEIFDGDESLNLDDTLSIFGVSTEHIIPVVRWDLASRLATNDREIHIVLKRCAGFSQEDIRFQLEFAGVFCTRERVSQTEQGFFQRLHAMKDLGDPWIGQTIYALGLCDVLRTCERCHGVELDVDPIDILCPFSFEDAKKMQTVDLAKYRQKLHQSLRIQNNYIKPQPKKEARIGSRRKNAKTARIS